MTMMQWRRVMGMDLLLLLLLLSLLSYQGFIFNQPPHHPSSVYPHHHQHNCHHPSPLKAGLSWRTEEIFHQQPDFPVLFLATRNETYAREVERHFGDKGYFVRTVRTLTRLSKMVKTTRPEAILLSTSVPTASLKDQPDLWLIPIIMVHDGGDPEAPIPPSTQLERLDMLKLGVRCFVNNTYPFVELQGAIEGAGLTRQRVETLVGNLQGAVLHFSQHRRRLLPSTMLLEEPPPPFTSTEQEVLNLLTRGMTDAQVAYSLSITQAAVSNTAKNLMEKLKVDTRGEILRIALDNDLVTE